MNRLLILSPEAEKYAELIRREGLHDLEIIAADNVESAATRVTKCNIILGAPILVSEVLHLAQQLDWVQSSWAGVDCLCKPGLRRDYVLTGAKEVFGSSISEYVLTYLFAFERRVFVMHSNQLNKRWEPLPYRRSHEITLGIAGLGSIGRQLARTARVFGIHVVALNRSGRYCEDVEKVYTIDKPGGFFERSDYVVLTLPDTTQTRHFINADVLRMMKPSSVLINVGRGMAINEEDLVCALREGLIGGAVLDVFTNEPLAQDNPLWRMPNVYITPHTAAVSFPEDIIGIFIDNYQRYIKNKSLQFIIDFELGY